MTVSTETSGSGEYDPQGEYIISYQGLETGGECVMRSCTSVPSSVEEVGSHCPVYAVGPVTQEWLDAQGIVPDPGNVPRDLLLRCRDALTAPLISKGMTPGDLLDVMNNYVAFSSACEETGHHAEATCNQVGAYATKLWEERAGTSGSTGEITTVTPQGQTDTSQETTPADPKDSTGRPMGTGNPPGLNHGKGPKEKATRWPEWILNEARKSVQDPEYDPLNQWKERGKKLLLTHLDHLQTNGSPAIDFGQSLIWKGQKKLEATQKQIWSHQTYFGIAMGGVSFITLVATLILFIRYAHKARKSFSTRLAEKKERTESQKNERRERRKRERARELAGTMQEIGLLPEPIHSVRDGPRAAGLASPEGRGGVTVPLLSIENHCLSTKRLSGCAEPRADPKTMTQGVKKKPFFGLGKKSDSHPNLDFDKVTSSPHLEEEESGAAAPPPYRELTTVSSAARIPEARTNNPKTLGEQISFFPHPQNDWERRLNEIARNPPRGLEYMVEDPSASPRVGGGGGAL